MSFTKKELIVGGLVLGIVSLLGFWKHYHSRRYF
jgi:hypothetical protein